MRAAAGDPGFPVGLLQTKKGGSTMAHKTTTQKELYRSETLYVAFELSKKSWRVLCSTGGVKKLSATMSPGNSAILNAFLARAKKKFYLFEDPRVLICI